MRASSAVAAVVLLLAACTETPGTGGTNGPKVGTTDTGPVLPFDHPVISGAGGGTGGSGGSGGSGGPVNSGAQRLSVDQLRLSLPIVLGNDMNGDPVTWKIGGGVGFDTRSATLGEADYLNRVENDLEPSPLYVKFMFDMAKDSCNRAIVSDNGKSQAQRALTRWVGNSDTVATAPAAVDKNLRALKLVFHGVKVAETDDAPIAAYRKLFDDSVKASAGTAAVRPIDVTEGWRAVCVGLLTAPEYHFY